MGLIGGWCVYDNWSHPCYWDYGSDEYIYYRDNYVYVDGQQYLPVVDYYTQVNGLAHSVPAYGPDEIANIQWMPLGVFAISRPGSPVSTETVQLAVSKEGILSGTMYNQQDGSARPVQGMVEQATQRAAWCYADGSNDPLVVETSLYNYTTPQFTAMAHYDPRNQQVWQMVRLNQPEGQAMNQPGMQGPQMMQGPQGQQAQPFMQGQPGQPVVQNQGMNQFGQ